MGYETITHDRKYEELRQEALNEYHRLKSDDNLRKNRLITELMKKYD